MDAKELRIGNFVTYKNNEVIVTGVTNDPLIMFNIDGQGYFGDHEKEFNPIPLTEKWLIKFGFEKKQINTKNIGLVDYLSPLDIQSDYGCTIDLDENQVWLRDCDGGKIGVQIQYVHQLQNLYFALTGEELTIKTDLS